MSDQVKPSSARPRSATPPARKPRRYDASRRRAAAAQTRRAIFAAANKLFLAGGYAATTMNEVAAAAGVALDTVYAVAGPKPQLFRMLIETAISGTDEARPVLQRDYIPAIRAAADARGKLAAYAAAMGAIQQRLAPLFSVLQAAAPAEPELTALWEGLLRRRAQNMPLLVEELAQTGELRQELSPRDAADLIWAINSTEVYMLLTRTRGWAHARYVPWLTATLQRLLLQ